MNMGECLIVGLTGSIGMGKSAVAAMFKEQGVPVSDADATVHEMYALGGAAVGPVGEAFPEVIVDGAVYRPALSKRVIGDSSAMKKLEVIVHPIVRAARDDFVERMRRSGETLAVLDVPLLFENDLQRECDEVLVVSAPADVQRRRVLAR